MIFGNIIVLILWTLNTMIDNHGGILHFIWWYSTMGTTSLVFLNFAFVILAFFSYGTRD